MNQLTWGKRSQEQLTSTTRSRAAHSFRVSAFPDRPSLRSGGQSLLPCQDELGPDVSDTSADVSAQHSHRVHPAGAWCEAQLDTPVAGHSSGQAVLCHGFGGILTVCGALHHAGCWEQPYPAWQGTALLSLTLASWTSVCRAWLFGWFVCSSTIVSERPLSLYPKLL